MLSPIDIESKLGFDRIREILISYCLSDLGKEYVAKLAFCSDYRHLNNLLNQTEEFRRLLDQKDNFPNSNYIDIRNHLTKAAILNAWLTEDELFDISLFLKTIEASMVFLRNRQNDFPALSEITGLVNFDPHLCHAIDLKIDDKGQLRSNASDELLNIRKRIQLEQTKVRNVADKILRKTIADGFTPDDASITIRNGRLVIPIRSEHKRKVKGFIHDESASGQTCYIEPAEALEINNEIRDLEYAEKREIIRILMYLTDQIRPEIPKLRKASQYLGLIDFIRAKASLALLIGGVLPHIQPQPVIDWKMARHPLLMLALKESGKKIVPLNITLDPEHRILIISGPNAGGKSVCLKTVGLLQYMIQCGLLVPMNEGSRMGLFNRIFIDIGDEQSIENDLSTYSSHLIHMKFFISNANRNTLFLIDEFGTGTEPQFGAAIAESVLIELRKSKAWGVVTTHYANLKKYGEKTPGVINGAMRFDMKNLAPTFQLDIGRPGSSFAIEIAQKIGLPGHVLANAKKKAGYDQVKFDRLINELEQEKANLQKQIAKNIRKEDQLKKTTTEYESLKSFLQEREKEIIEEARLKAEELFKEANRKIENTIRVIKEVNAEKIKTRKAREELETYVKKIVGKEKTSAKKIRTLKGTIEIGDYAKIKGSDSYGKIENITGNIAILIIGEIKTSVELTGLERIEKPAAELEALKRTQSNKQDILRNKRASFNPVLDIRGKRAEEIYPILDTYLDEATMLGSGEIRILHGKGDGILRRIVRDQLKQYPSIEDFHDEHVERGGAGITVVILK